MILDNLKNAEMYYVQHPLFKEAFECIKTTDFLQVEPGKTELRGRDLFVIVSDSDMRDESEADIEVHNKYIDIQLPINKAETYGWASRASIRKAKAPFDTEKDIQFFEDENTTVFSAVPGDFVVFFPSDGHAPCIGEGKIRKVVVKIKL